MAVLMWWLIPIAATLLAVAWLWWQSYTGADETGKVHSYKELDKMRQAMAKPLPAGSVERQDGVAQVSPEVVVLGHMPERDRTEVS
jgi:hypothetical protein